MKKVAFYCPADSLHEEEFQKMANSLKKFHPDIPLLRWNDDRIKLYNDQMFFYRAGPVIAHELMKEYEYLVKIDSDTIITGDLSELWTGDFDVAVVNNSNPRDFKSYPYQLWDIHPFAYVNAGLVVLHSEEFINHWLKLCLSGHFAAYQMREQDLLNIIIHYGNYKIKRLDEGDSFYGLAAKQYTSHTKLIDNKIILEKDAGEDGWPDKQKQIRAYHFGGGNIPNKYNYRLIFPEEVANYIDTLIK